MMAAAGLLGTNGRTSVQRSEARQGLRCAAFTWTADPEMAATKDSIRVSLIGSVVGGSHLGYANAQCKWRLVVSPGWKHVSGALSGTSHWASAHDNAFSWCHPVDACFDCSVAGMQETAWPRVEMEVRWCDEYGRVDHAGYSVVKVPPTVGIHSLSGHVWRPIGSLVDSITAFFLGGNPRLKDASLIFGVEEVSEEGSGTSLARAAGRHRLKTASGGIVYLNLGVCMQRRQVLTEGL